MFKWRPRDQWGRINCVSWGRYSMTWALGRGRGTKMWAWRWRTLGSTYWRITPIIQLTFAINDEL